MPLHDDRELLAGVVGSVVEKMFRSQAESSSIDGGDSWQELTNGLPSNDKGRIALAIAASRSTTVYATVEAEKTALYRW